MNLRRGFALALSLFLLSLSVVPASAAGSEDVTFSLPLFADEGCTEALTSSSSVAYAALPRGSFSYISVYSDSVSGQSVKIYVGDNVQTTTDSESVLDYRFNSHENIMVYRFNVKAYVFNNSSSTFYNVIKITSSKPGFFYGVEVTFNSVSTPLVSPVRVSTHTTDSTMQLTPYYQYNVMQPNMGDGATNQYGGLNLVQDLFTSSDYAGVAGNISSGVYWSEPGAPDVSNSGRTTDVFLDTGALAGGGYLQTDVISYGCTVYSLTAFGRLYGTQTYVPIDVEMETLDLNEDPNTNLSWAEIGSMYNRIAANQYTEFERIFTPTFDFRHQYKIFNIRIPTDQSYDGYAIRLNYLRGVSISLVSTDSAGSAQLLIRGQGGFKFRFLHCVSGDMNSGVDYSPSSILQLNLLKDIQQEVKIISGNVEAIRDILTQMYSGVSADVSQAGSDIALNESKEQSAVSSAQTSASNLMAVAKTPAVIGQALTAFSSISSFLSTDTGLTILMCLVIIPLSVGIISKLLNGGD